MIISVFSNQKKTNTFINNISCISSPRFLMNRFVVEGNSCEFCFTIKQFIEKKCFYNYYIQKQCSDKKKLYYKTVIINALMDEKK